MAAIAAEAVAERVGVVRRRIEAAGGDPEAVTIVAVTKGVGAGVPRAARDAGLVDVGENYAQELLAKAADVDGLRWHFVGRLQRNKIKELARAVHLWHTVDRPSVADGLGARCPGAAVLVQVNASGEP